MPEPAMVAGFTAIGMDVVLVGPMPTPAVAMLTPSLRADLGVVISASHNPYQDNGIKLRSEEHTSELQSLMRISYAVFCLKKKKTHINKITTTDPKIKKIHKTIHNTTI